MSYYIAPTFHRDEADPPDPALPGITCPGRQLPDDSLEPITVLDVVFMVVYQSATSQCLVTTMATPASVPSGWTEVDAAAAATFRASADG